MNISAKDVSILREITGAGIMDCKEALKESCGDRKQAIDILRVKGIAKLEKKEHRLMPRRTYGEYGILKKNGTQIDTRFYDDGEVVETKKDVNGKILTVIHYASKEEYLKR